MPKQMKATSTITLPPECWEYLDKVKAESGQSRNQQVEAMIREKIAKGDLKLKIAELALAYGAKPDSELTKNGTQITDRKAENDGLPGYSWYCGDCSLTFLSPDELQTTCPRCGSFIRA